MKAQQGSGLEDDGRADQPTRAQEPGTKPPKSKRSAGRRLGARRRDLCRTRSCCFKRILSARTARVPPIRRRTASAASRCTSNTIVFFMDKQLARHWSRGQGSRIAAGAPLNYEFAMYSWLTWPPTDLQRTKLWRRPA